MTIDEVLSHFESVRRNGRGYVARCPAHEDRVPSLSIKEAGGRVLLYCFGGCKTADVLAAAGLTWADLGPPVLVNGRQYGGARKIIETYAYTDEGGGLLYQVCRYEPKDFRQRRPDSNGGWIWNLDGVQRVLYGLPRLLATGRPETVFVVEGEKDAGRLQSLGLTATTNAGGAIQRPEQWRSEYSEALRGRSVIILPDNDDAGHRHARLVAGALLGIAASVKVLSLPGLPQKGDISDWLDAGHPAEELVKLAEEAPEYTPGDGEQASAGGAIPEFPVLYNREIGKSGIIEIWLQPEPAPRRWTVPGLLPEGCISTWYGDAGVFKSWLACYLASVKAGGLHFLEHAMQAAPVIFIDAELDDEEFIRRAYQVGRGLGLSRPPEGLYYYRLPGSLADPAVIEGVRELVESTQAGLVILDSLTMACFGADLKEAGDVTAILRGIETWGTVLTLDHIAKPMAGANLSHYRPFGSQFKYAGARSVVQIVKAESGRGLMLRPVKSNFSALGEPVGVEIKFHSDRVVFASAQLTDEAMAGLDAHLPAKEQVLQALVQQGQTRPEALAEVLGMAEKTVRNHLSALRAEGRVNTTGGEWQPANSRFPDCIEPGNRETVGEATRKPLRICPVCKGNEFGDRQGDLICARCHPSPHAPAGTYVNGDDPAMVPF